METDDLVKVARAKVLSKAWYGIQLWMDQSITLKKDIDNLNTAIGTLLRHVLQDYERKFNREKMHKILNIPTTLEWSKYSTFTLANSICMNTLPNDLFVDILAHASPSYSNRQAGTRIFTSVHCKTGDNIFVNRISQLLRNIKLVSEKTFCLDNSQH